MPENSTKKTNEKGRQAYLRTLGAAKVASIKEEKHHDHIYDDMDAPDFEPFDSLGRPTFCEPPESLDLDECVNTSGQESLNMLIDEIDRLNVENNELSNENLELMKSQMALIEDYTALSKMAHEIALSHAALASSAEALIKRWHTPKWKDVEHTRVFIEGLERALRLSNHTSGESAPIKDDYE